MARRALEAVPQVSGNELTFQLKEWFGQVFKHYRIIETQTITINPANVPANTTAEQTFTLTGAEIADTVLAVTKPTHTAGFGIVGTRISAADTVAITFMNNTAGAIDAPSESYKIDLLKFRGN